MDAFTLQPAAGAHGEFTGVLLIKAYHTDRGDTARTKIIVPDSAHGTNPATAAENMTSLPLLSAFAIPTPIPAPMRVFAKFAIVKSDFPTKLSPIHPANIAKIVPAMSVQKSP